jgi:hypothetical protein
MYKYVAGKNSSNLLTSISFDFPKISPRDKETNQLTFNHPKIFHKVDMINQTYISKPVRINSRSCRKARSYLKQKCPTDPECINFIDGLATAQSNNTPTICIKAAEFGESKPVYSSITAKLMQRKSNDGYHVRVSI